MFVVLARCVLSTVIVRLQFFVQVASLFSGCGGLDLGLQQAGHDVALLVSVYLLCYAVTKRNSLFQLTHDNFANKAQ
jgi:hypothetical protein